VSSLYCVNVRWVKTEFNTDAIEKQLGQCGDWLRFNGWAWLSYSTYSAGSIANHVRIALANDDNIMVIKCDPNDYGGWAQPWVWDWINKKRPPAANSMGLSAIGGLGGGGSAENALSGHGMSSPNPFDRK
jgi:hypothetical protein